MRTFKKGIAATAITTAAVAGVLFAPSMAAAEEADCAVQVTAVQQTVTDLTAAVALPVKDDGLPLPGADPLALAAQLQTQVAALGAAGCLPALPTGGAAAVTACVDLTADLNVEVAALIAALVGTEGPDLVVAAEVAADLSVTVTALVGDGCLVEAPV